METQRFDELTRALARARTRRGVLRALLGGAAAGVAALAGREAAAAQRQPTGATCSRATDCATYRCVDGVCCDTSCTGQCESCATGTCLPVSGPPDPGKPPCPGSGPCQAICDGITRAHCAAYPGPETMCGPSTCADGWQTTAACAGNGSCTPSTISCAPYGCAPDGSGCRTGCASDDECPGTAHCVAGVCRDDLPLGGPCAHDAQCQSGVCSQGICCIERCGPCEACDLPGNEGFCGPAPDGGACDGGTCCDGACVDPQTDVTNCGGCDTSCPGIPNGRAVCVGATCDVECRSGFRRCDEPELRCIPEDGCCTDAECGHLADQCTAGVCVADVCEQQAANENQPCDDEVSCTTGETCQDGVCTGGQPIRDGQSCDGGVCCGGSCCPPSCQCRTSVNGTFCLSGRFVYGCQDDSDCPAGELCREDPITGLKCQYINCRDDSSICPPGSQCTGNVSCSELCTAV